MFLKCGKKTGQAYWYSRTNTISVIWENSLKIFPEYIKIIIPFLFRD